jgi:hypothetical protein
MVHGAGTNGFDFQRYLLQKSQVWLVAGSDLIYSVLIARISGINK